LLDLINIDQTPYPRLTDFLVFLESKQAELHALRPEVPSSLIGIPP